jgi:hypothetical protein
MLVKVADVTLSCAVPVTEPSDALIVTLPVAMPVDIPLAPVLPIVATVASLDVQLTSLVMIWVLESLNTPVAPNASWLPGAIEEIEGVTEVDVIVALVTLSLTETLCDARVAVIVVMPGLRPCARPPD